MMVSCSRTGKKTGYYWENEVTVTEMLGSAKNPKSLEPSGKEKDEAALHPYWQGNVA
jgi:hypothetical protein